jgi:hypothetical protein
MPKVAGPLICAAGQYNERLGRSMKRLLKIVVWILGILAVAFVIQLVAFLYLTSQGPFAGGPGFTDQARIESLRWSLFALAGTAALIATFWVVLRRTQRLRPNHRL